MFPIRDTIPSRYTPFATVGLISINGAVFLYELSLSPAELMAFFQRYGVVPAALRSGAPWGEWLSLLTSMFLHGGWFHIIANMWALWLFGDNVEDRMGIGRFLAFYLLTGLAAGATHAVLNPNSTVPTVGASGAVAGVMGAYFVLFPRSTLIVVVPFFFWPVLFEVPAVIYLLLWFLGELFSGTLSLAVPGDVGGIAFWAHVGGFVAGVVLHPIFLRPRQVYRRWFADETHYHPERWYWRER
ncbi:MAG: rhomboid family intramembrane serine protease [Candidatus Poribacteria bacterium]|nr:MAG: rhomboid family intramembrane serine protease [Candidatus Poribacteria bacterium]